MAGFSEHGKECSGCIEGGKLCDHLSYLLKKDSALCG
jgi:hypothetical protein